jgi:hypothetical protein
MDAFNNELAKVQQEAAEKNDPNIVLNFYKHNTQWGINPEFYE